jgi:arabinofuranosyltransferase
MLPALRPITRWAPLAIAGVVLIWHALQYRFVTDDAFISFVFSRNFAEHGELSFNPGYPPVEGYTNFLWTFLLGLLAVVGIPLEPASIALGIGFGLGGLWMSFRIMERILGRGHPLAAVPALLLACSAGYACWSSGGLETQLYTFLVAAALDAYLAADEEPRMFRRVGIYFALASMTRPEGPLLVALFGVHRLARNLLVEKRWKPSKDELLAAAFFLGIWAPWFAWRWWYYGWPFPNTYYVKATDPPPKCAAGMAAEQCAQIRAMAAKATAAYDAKMRHHGWHYVGRWFQQTALVWVSPLAVLGLGGPPKSVRFAFGTLAALVTGVYLYYVVGVGGDFMGLHRFIMPLFVLAAITVTLGADNLIQIGSRLSPMIKENARVFVAGALVAGFFSHQFALTKKSLKFGNWAPDDGIDTPSFLSVYAHDRALIGKKLRACVKHDDFAIYGGVGAMPWHAHLKGIDVFGLVSSRIAHEVPRGRDRAGHNKWGPDTLLAQYNPTIVMHCYAIRNVPGVAPLGCAGYWEGLGFERVVLHVPGMLEKGQYYTFLVKRDRNMQCPGLSR